MNASRLVGAVLLAVSFTSALRAADPLDKLPADINAAAWVDVAAIYKSPLATEQQWTKKALQALVANQPVVPPGVESLAIGAKMSFDDRLSSQGEYAVATVGKDLTLQKFASLTGGSLDTLSGRNVLSTSRGVQVVGESDNTWLVVSTGGRQAAARWIRDLHRSGGLNSTLRLAVDQKQPGEQIVIAFELTDLFSVKDIEDRLADVELTGTNPAAAAEILSSVQTVTFYIGVGKDVSGRVVTKFAKPAAPLASSLPALLNQLELRTGASLPDLETWKFEVKGDSIVGSGALSPQGARRLLSVLNPPAILEAAAAAGDSAADSRTQTIEASRRYLHSIRATLDDVQDTLKKRRDNRALWLDKAARKIDDLPLLNVDESLLEFSAKVTGSLRYQAQAERSTRIRAGTEKAQTGANNLYPYVAYGPYGGAWFGVGNPVSKEAISAEQNEQSMSVRLDEMKAIENGYTQIRQDLTKKYMAEF